MPEVLYLRGIYHIIENYVSYKTPLKLIEAKGIANLFRILSMKHDFRARRIGRKLLPLIEDGESREIIRQYLMA